MLLQHTRYPRVPLSSAGFEGCAKANSEGRGKLALSGFLGSLQAFSGFHRQIFIHKISFPSPHPMGEVAGKQEEGAGGRLLCGAKVHLPPSFYPSWRPPLLSPARSDVRGAKKSPGHPVRRLTSAYFYCLLLGRVSPFSEPLVVKEKPEMGVTSVGRAHLKWIREAMKGVGLMHVHPCTEHELQL